MSKTELAQAEKDLCEKQERQLEELEAKQRDEIRSLEKDSDKELRRGIKEVETAIEERKKLVSLKLRFVFCYPVSSRRVAVHDRALVIMFFFHVFFRKQAIDEHNTQFDREMLQRGKNLSKDEFENLMRMHKDQVHSLERNLDREKERQRKTLADKVNQTEVK